MPNGGEYISSGVEYISVLPTPSSALDGIIFYLTEADGGFDAKTYIIVNDAGTGFEEFGENVLVDNATIEYDVDTLRVKNLGITTAKLADDSVNKDKINADIAGLGLVQAPGGELDVNVDDSTLEINTTLRVKDLGITEGKLSLAVQSKLNKPTFVKDIDTNDWDFDLGTKPTIGVINDFKVMSFIGVDTAIYSDVIAHAGFVLTNALKFKYFYRMTNNSDVVNNVAIQVSYRVVFQDTVGTPNANAVLAYQNVENSFVPTSFNGIQSMEITIPALNPGVNEVYLPVIQLRFSRLTDTNTDTFQLYKSQVFQDG